MLWTSYILRCVRQIQIARNCKRNVVISSVERYHWKDNERKALWVKMAAHVQKDRSQEATHYH